jgi:hypothetical protein
VIDIYCPTTSKTKHKPTSNTMGVPSSTLHSIEVQWFPEFKKNLPSLENKTIAITGTMLYLSHHDLMTTFLTKRKIMW